MNSIESRSRVNTCIDGTQGFGEVFNLALPLIEIEPRKFNESKSAHNTEAEYIRKKRRTSNDEQSYSAKIQFQLRPRHMHCIACIDHDTFSRSRCVCVCMWLSQFSRKTPTKLFLTPLIVSLVNVF